MQEEIQQKTCAYKDCQSVFQRLPGRSDKVWNSTRYCSASCGYLARRKEKTKYKKTERARKVLETGMEIRKTYMCARSCAAKPNSENS